MGSPKLLYLFMFMYVLYVFPEVVHKLITVLPNPGSVAHRQKAKNKRQVSGERKVALIRKAGNLGSR